MSVDYGCSVERGRWLKNSAGGHGVRRPCGTSYDPAIEQIGAARSVRLQETKAVMLTKSPSATRRPYASSN
jgi:hypothetical protein